MHAVILAAGQGTRLQPLTVDTPKVMVDVQGTPILAHSFAALPDRITNVTIVRGYLGERIEAYFGAEHLGRSVSYVDQSKLAGTAHALWCARAQITNDQPFLVLHGDNLYSAQDLNRLTSGPLALGVYRYVRPTVKLVFDADKTGRLTGAHVPTATELTQPLAVCTGSYLVDRRIFLTSHVTIDGGEAGLPHTVLVFAKQIPIQLFEHTFWQEVNTLQDLDRAQELRFD